MAAYRRTISYNDFANQEMARYIAQNSGASNEVQNQADWVSKLQALYPNVGGNELSPTLATAVSQDPNLLQKVQSIGGIGFDPAQRLAELHAQNPGDYVVDPATGNLTTYTNKIPDYFGDITGYAIPAAVGAGIAGWASGTSALAGGGEVGSGYAASAPASDGTVFGGSATGGGFGGGTAINTGISSGAPMDTGAGFDFGMTGNEGGPVGGAASSFGLGDIWNFVKSNPSIVGSLAGALLGGAKGGSQPAGTVTTTQDLAPWLAPYAQANVAQGAKTLAGINPNNPLLPASQNQALKTINGDYLNPSSNPYLAASVNDALGLAKSQINSQYTGAFGDTNNSGYQEALARGLGSAATNAYLQNYNTERQNQNTAAFGAPQLVSQANAAYFSPNQAFAGLFPNVTSTQTPYFQNQLGSIFGGALAGGALGKAFGG